MIISHVYSLHILTSHPCQLSWLAFWGRAQWVMAIWLSVRKKQQVLHYNRSCNQDCWYADLVGWRHRLLTQLQWDKRWSYASLIGFNPKWLKAPQRDKSPLNETHCLHENLLLLLLFVPLILRKKRLKIAGMVFYGLETHPIASKH